MITTPQSVHSTTFYAWQFVDPEQRGAGPAVVPTNQILQYGSCLQCWPIKSMEELKALTANWRDNVRVIKFNHTLTRIIIISYYPHHILSSHSQSLCGTVKWITSTAAANTSSLLHKQHLYACESVCELGAQSAVCTLMYMSIMHHQSEENNQNKCSYPACRHGAPLLAPKERSDGELCF